MSEFEHFTLRTEDGIASIVMKHPPLNVMDNPMMAEFNELLEPLVNDSRLAAIVIGAEGKAFSAGVDVGDHSADKVADMIDLFHGIFRKLAATDALTIALVNASPSSTARRSGAAASSPVSATSCSPPRRRSSASPK
jgi:cyclohexa-1,5-dienecarbonyl-CoA hydratase